MSQFTSVSLENLYVNSACVTGPTIDNLMVAPCVNEEYREPHVEPINDHILEEFLLKDDLDKRVEAYLREEEERYDEMIMVDRLKDIDLNERIDNYRVDFEEKENEYYEYIFAGEKERYHNTFTEEEWDAIMLDKVVSKANAN